MTQAKEAAGDKNVLVHGAGVAQLALAAGVLDELELHVVPVLFGQGRRLFEGLAAEQIELQRTRDPRGRGRCHPHALPRPALRNTMTRKRLDDLARTIIDSNRYMALGTADPDGHPWVSPVWFASEDYKHFHWVSSPDARHSRNVAARPEVAIAIFDSTVPVGGAQAVYMSGRAEELTDTELEHGIEVFGRLSEEDDEDVEVFSRRRAAAVSSFASTGHGIEALCADPRPRPRLRTGVDRREPVTPSQPHGFSDGRRHDDEGMGCRGGQAGATTED